MKQVLAISWLIFMMGSSYCDRQPASPRSSILGRYELSAHDDSGRIAFAGTISFTSQEQQHLKGDCKVVRGKDAPEGILDQEGRCEGSIDGKKVTIDLAPAVDDGGLVLEGQVDEGRITGEWMFDTFAGSKPLGKFEAVQKK